MMWHSVNSIIVLSLIVTVELAKNDLYIGHRIYNVQFTNVKQQENYDMLKDEMIDFLRKPCFERNSVGQALVPPTHLDWFEERLGESGIDIDVYIDDVFEYLLKKDKSNDTRYDGNNFFDFDGYYRYDQILQYLYNLEATTNSIEVVEYGTTDEGNPLVYVKVASDPTIEKPIVIIEAGIIPREWITIPAAIYVINRLFDTDEFRFLNHLDWIIIPVVNPDGYEYTHSDLRLWSKSLSTRSSLGFICPGVNINRNFDIEWLASDSSSSPCSHLYAGVESFSEIESQMLRSIIDEYGSRISLYISIQNNGEFISYPWQFERAASGMFRQHHYLVLDMIDAINSSYSLGAGALVSGDRASGTSSDFAQKSGVLYSFNVNIDQDEYDGVIIPEENIEDAVGKVWRAIRVAADLFI